jgi:hypothetical protein
LKDVRFWHKADILAAAVAHVRFWHKADIPLSPGNVRYWGKADIVISDRHVCF